MNFELAAELRHFGESVRAALREWEAPLEPDLGTWLDDRDDDLTIRLTGAGWQALWEVGDDLGPVVAGAVEIGRAAAPLSTLDEATLGAPLAVAARIRHGEKVETCALAQPHWGLAIGRPAAKRKAEPTLDGTGTVVVEIADVAPLSGEESEARWSAWTAATLGYLAGLAGAAQTAAVDHARVREQFGRPLAKMPALQARLADAALAVDGLLLIAWQSAAPENVDRVPALLWAGSTCRDVTASAHQVHGAIGFALETGLHRYYRRAKAAQVWAAAVCRACA